MNPYLDGYLRLFSILKMLSYGLDGNYKETQMITDIVYLVSA